MEPSVEIEFTNNVSLVHLVNHYDIQTKQTK